MKALTLSILIASLALGPAATAKQRSQQPANQNSAHLKKALAAVGATSQSLIPPPKTDDKDQGDDNANPEAIIRVCSKETPAARRSAICPIGVSPE